MAIILDRWIETTDGATLPPAQFIFNNRIVKFHSDTIPAADVDYAILYGYKFYPDPNGYFEINLRDIFMNISNYWEVDLKTFVLGPYWDELFYRQDFNFLPIIYKNDGTTDTYGSELHISLCAKLADDGYKTSFDVENPQLNDFRSFIGNNITIFDGYPFDFTLGGNMDVTNGADVALFTNSLIKRIGVTDGADFIPDFDGTFKLLYGSGYIDIINFNVKKCEGGVYLKWFSPSAGSWKYWLFNERHKEEVSIKDNGYWLNNFADDSSNMTRFRSLGKNSRVNKYTLKASGLQAYERDYIIDIITSPTVYIYQNRKFKLVEMNTRSLAKNDFGKNSDIQIQITEYLTSL